MTLHEAAAYWFVYQDAGGRIDSDREAFENWLESSPEHRRAYEQTKAMWDGIEEVADEGELRVLRVSALSDGPTTSVWPRALGVAATMVVTITGIVALTLQFSTVPETSVDADALQASVGQYTTARNQRSTVTLPDGTLVSMNLDSAFRADFTAEHRLIHFSKGQAFFDVSKDLRRPFIVTAADRKIQALGTMFEVRLDRNRLEVVLLEGRVSVVRSQPALLEKIRHQSARVDLKPDQKLVVDPDEKIVITATNALQATSWRDGWIVLEDETVEQAIAELNRYSDRPLVAAEDVRLMRLSGVFRIGQPERFGATIQELLPVQVKQGTQGETLLVRKPTQ